MNIQTDTTFSIGRWQELVIEKKTHHVECQNGKLVRIICTDKNDNEFVIVGLVQKSALEASFSFRADGFAYQNGTSEWDLVIVPNPPKSLGWLVVWKIGKSTSYKLYDTEAQASEGRYSYLKETPLSITEIFEGQGL